MPPPTLPSAITFWEVVAVVVVAFFIEVVVPGTTVSKTLPTTFSVAFVTFLATFLIVSKIDVNRSKLAANREKTKEDWK